MISGGSTVDVRIFCSGSERAQPLRVSDTIFRIGQEAIANAIRYAHPARLTLSLLYKAASVELIVEDDGCGFLVSSEFAGFGIRGMGKRADSISARFAIHSNLGGGTSVHVVVPLPPSFLRSYWQRIPWRKRSHEQPID